MKILIAGAGHGGLAAAGILAANGADVTVAERYPKENLGYDWTDIFDLRSFKEAGIPMPGPEDYWQSEDMTFVSPSRKATLRAAANREAEAEAVMERRVILRHLIAFAEARGVQFLFETEVAGPGLEGNRVTGLLVRDKDGERELHANLVIDAAGMHSPVRAGLPERFGIDLAFAREQYFTVYRAHYVHTGAQSPGNPFSVYFFPLGRRSINWIAEEQSEYVDQLCGSFGDTDQAYAEEVKASVQERHPGMGEKIYRGGEVVQVPVRRPLSRMVADGYAALGDSAAMTVPLVGSGIANAVRAGQILAETVLRSAERCSGEESLPAAALWPYQVEYMRRIGAVHAALDVLKSFMLSLRPEQIDCIFEKELMGSDEMTKARSGREIILPLPRLLQLGLRGAGNPLLLITLGRAYFASRKMKRHALRIPASYDEKAIKAWAANYDAIS